jgi:hypothetical protein
MVSPGLDRLLELTDEAARLLEASAASGRNDQKMWKTWAATG